MRVLYTTIDNLFVSEKNPILRQNNKTMKRIILTCIAAAFISCGLCSAKRVNVLARADLGYSISNSELRGVLSADAGAYANVWLFGPLAVESGLEFKTGGMRVYSSLGGLTSSEDFKESYKYRLNYLGVPLCVRFVGEGKWYDGIYLGPAINFSMGGTTTYKRVGTGMQGVDANDTYKIKNLKSPVVSFKMGFDQKFSEKLGFHFEIESTFNPFNRSSESSSVSMRNFKFGITYYIL